MALNMDTLGSSESNPRTTQKKAGGHSMSVLECQVVIFFSGSGD